MPSEFRRTTEKAIFKTLFPTAGPEFPSNPTRRHTRGRRGHGPITGFLLPESDLVPDSPAKEDHYGLQRAVTLDLRKKAKVVREKEILLRGSTSRRAPTAPMSRAVRTSIAARVARSARDKSGASGVGKSERKFLKEFDSAKGRFGEKGGRIPPAPKHKLPWELASSKHHPKQATQVTPQMVEAAARKFKRDGTLPLFHVDPEKRPPQLARSEWDKFTRAIARQPSVPAPPAASKSLQAARVARRAKRQAAKIAKKRTTHEGLLNREGIEENPGPQFDNEHPTPSGRYLENEMPSWLRQRLRGYWWFAPARKMALAHMAHNRGVSSLVVRQLLLMAGIEQNPGPPKLNVTRFKDIKPQDKPAQHRRGDVRQPKKRGEAGRKAPGEEKISILKGMFPHVADHLISSAADTLTYTEMAQLREGKLPASLGRLQQKAAEVTACVALANPAAMPGLANPERTPSPVARPQTPTSPVTETSPARTPSPDPVMPSYVPAVPTPQCVADMLDGIAPLACPEPIVPARPQSQHCPCPTPTGSPCDDLQAARKMPPTETLRFLESPSDAGSSTHLSDAQLSRALFDAHSPTPPLPPASPPGSPPGAPPPPAHSSTPPPPPASPPGLPPGVPTPPPLPPPPKQNLRFGLPIHYTLREPPPADTRGDDGNAPMRPYRLVRRPRQPAGPAPAPVEVELRDGKRLTAKQLAFWAPCQVDTSAVQGTRSINFEHTKCDGKPVVVQTVRQPKMVTCNFVLNILGFQLPVTLSALFRAYFMLRVVHTIFVASWGIRNELWDLAGWLYTAYVLGAHVVSIYAAVGVTIMPKTPLKRTAYDIACFAVALFKYCRVYAHVLEHGSLSLPYAFIRIVLPHLLDVLCSPHQLRGSDSVLYCPALATAVITEARTLAAYIDRSAMLLARHVATLAIPATIVEAYIEGTDRMVRVMLAHPEHFQFPAAMAGTVGNTTAETNTIRQRFLSTVLAKMRLRHRPRNPSQLSSALRSNRSLIVRGASCFANFLLALSIRCIRHAVTLATATLFSLLSRSESALTSRGQIRPFWGG